MEGKRLNKRYTAGRRHVARQVEKDDAWAGERRRTTTCPTTLVIVTLSRLYRNIQSSLLREPRRFPAIPRDRHTEAARNIATSRGRATPRRANSRLFIAFLRLHRSDSTACGATIKPPRSLDSLDSKKLFFVSSRGTHGFFSVSRGALSVS